jgi:hypothetical protein
MEFLKELILINNEYTIEKICEENNYDDLKIKEYKEKLLKRNNRLFIVNRGIIINEYNKDLRLLLNNNLYIKYR